MPDPNVAVMLKKHADTSRLEKDNVRFDVLQHTMHTNHFTVIETWQNQKALETHAVAALTKQYRADLQPTLGSPLDERVFKPLDCRGSGPFGP
jgi:quinol monooxygenase YgiN